MELRYRNSEGVNEVLPIGTNEVTIGRGVDADIVIHDSKVSRVHASIILWAGDYVIKDLGSRNGTKVNDERVEIAVLMPGDTISIGGCQITFDEEGARAPNTIIRSIEEEMRDGKGYKTIMKEIVDDVR